MQLAELWNSANTILGNFLVAWHPKAKEEKRTDYRRNWKNNTFGSILYRQVAGALARRIVNYAEEGMQIVQGVLMLVSLNRSESWSIFTYRNSTNA
jgi:phosphatidylserine decarboxylase